MLRITALAILCISCVQEYSVFANPTSDSCIEPNPPVRYFSFNLRPNEPCSGRGTCTNGKCTSCETWEGNKDGKHVVVKYSGKYCECDNISCPRFNGEVCAGHGRCDCGRCVCQGNYIGNDCADDEAVVDDVLSMMKEMRKNKST
ncbi:integrin beta-3-like [Paramacrobiotus metropolitanus]|uniref:integrin beta-3-like n=1 Tax=Paramacrobiotus metropolitanus TaxID=2943436 RepID=UPI0024461704|nr:integrin beta-3-like [Paramacrobiotus metropolitanus]XP_055350058.1 integrin beta-3-like [Paramacrobiotus metropolitanus]XP_055350059.1 integrin beta-3-like [Paramacrobiotus metropolitanus]